MKGLEIIRFYVEDDPVIASVDNRPLEDLETRDCDLFDMFDPIATEVIDARGSKSTLDDRLDVSLNEDGTLKAAVTFADNFLVVERAIPDDEVVVQPGTATKSDGSGFVNLAVDTPTSLSFPVVTAPGQVRYDLLTLDDAGALNRTAGVETVAPGDPYINAPTPPDNEIPLAIIRVLEDVTVVVNSNDITDVRELFAVRGQEGIESQHPGDDTFIAAPANLKEDLDRLRNEIKVTKGSVDWETDPTRDLNAVEAEVTTARGTEGSLDARLDVELFENGVLKRPADGYFGEIKIVRDSITPATRVDVERCQVWDTTYARVLQPASNTIVDGTLVGVPNGLDAGALAASTVYHIYAIGDSTDTLSDACLLSVAPGAPFGAAPTLPGGYDLYRRIGSVITDVGVTFISMRKIGGITLYEDIVKTTIFGPGVPPGGAYTPLATAAYVPETAERVILFCLAQRQGGAVGAQIFWRSGAVSPAAAGPGFITRQQEMSNNFDSHVDNWLMLEVDATAARNVEWYGAGPIGANTIVRVVGYVEDMKHFA